MKVGTDGSHNARAAFLVLLLLPFFLVLSACPPVVTDTLATQSTDKLPPTVTVTSPNVGSSYTANVTVTGTITDDALKAGDGLGTVRSIDYSIANDVLRKGKISIADDGTSTQVASYGFGTITWTKATNTFTFTVSTISPTIITGAITIIIDATDANGNESTSTLQLSQNSGPVITLSSPSGTNLKYIAGSTSLTVSGTVVNSSDDSKNDDNISSISWSVTGKNWGATINIVSGTTSYSVVNTGLVPSSNFTFDTATKIFSTTFTVPFINDQSLILTVAASDKNGHTTSLVTYLVADVSGPQMSLSSATTGLYYSPSYFTAPTVTGNVDMTTLQTMTFELTTSGGYDSNAITVYPTASNGTGYTGPLYYFDADSNSPTYGNFSFVMRSASNAALLSGKSGTATVTISAAGAKAATTAQYTILMDNTPPSITNVAISTSNSNTTHTKVGDTITLTFKASDTQSGMSGYPVVTIAGQIAAVSGPVGTSYTATRLIGSSDSAYDGLAIPYSITATDNVGNSATTSATSSILYYESTPTLSTVSIASSNLHPAWAKPNNTVTLTFQTARDLMSVPTVTLAGQTVIPTQTATAANTTYTATYTMPSGYTQGTVPFMINFTDAAGNAGASVSAITTGSNVIYDSIAPSGYSAGINQSIIYSLNDAAASFTFAGAEVGASYSYTISSSGGGTNVTGTGTISTGTDTIGSLNLSGLGDGTLTLSVTLTDPAGNPGSPVTSTKTKDATPPSGYSATIAQSYVNNANKTAITMNFAGAEVGASYSYTISSSGGGTNVTGSGTVNLAAQSFPNLDLSGLNDGTLTVSLTLTDVAGNPGSPVTTNKTKDIVAPSGYSATIAQSYVNNANKTAITMNFAGAEVGASYSYTISSSGGGTNVTGSGTVNLAAQSFPNLDLSGLNDGTLTVSLTLTDVAGNPGSPVTTNKTKDIVAPSGYSAGINQSIIYSLNDAAASFTFAGAEVGASYSYTISSSGGGTNVTGTGTISTGTDTIGSLNLSGLGDGTLTLSVTLTDPAGNPGSPVTSTKTKDATPPSGYSATIAQSYVNNANKTAITMNFAGAEVGASYSYTISSSGGGTNVTGSGTVNLAAQSFPNLDLSGLNDGTLTVSLTLTDVAGNPGSPVTTNKTKDIVAPSGYSATIAQSYVNNANKTAITMNFAGAEVGASYSYTISSSGGGTNVTGSGTVNLAAQSFPNLDLSGLNDGTLTVSLTLTDVAGNPGSPVTTNKTKDIVAPSGYSAGINQSIIYSLNDAAASFTFAGAEVGASYSYTISSSGGGTNVTGTGTISTGTDTIGSLNLSGLGDGTLTLSVTLTDPAGNPGSPVTSTKTKDATPPSGYSATIAQSYVNNANKTAITMNFAGAEVGASYSYTISSSGGGTNVTGSGTVNLAAQSFPNLDLSGLNDGTLTVSLTLTDVAGNPGSPVTTNKTKDIVAPSGYSATIAQSYVNNANKTAITMNFAGAEVGASYSYTISSSGGGTNVTGSGTVNLAAQSFPNLDLSGLNDGTLTVSLTLTDVAGNPGSPVTTNKTKDIVAPSGYSATIAQSYVNNANKTAITMNFAGAEVGASYSYTISSSGGGTNVTGSGTVNLAAQSFPNLDLSGLNDGTLTVSLTLTDVAGNPGSPVTTNKTKDIVAPSGYSATIAQSYVNNANKTAITMNFAGAEVGASYSYTISSSGGGTNVTGSGTVNLAAQSFSNLDLSGLNDGTLTVSLTLTDVAGNPGSPVTTNKTKDIVAPTITSLTISGTGSTAATIAFSKNVYKDMAGTTTIDTTSIAITDTTHPYTATPTFVSYGYDSGTGKYTAVYSLAWSTTPVTTPVADTIQAAAASAASIYDAAGNPMAVTSSGSDTAKLLAMLGIHVSPVVSGNAKNGNAFVRIGTWIQQVIAGSVTQDATATAGGSAGSVASATSVSMRTASTIQDRFRTAIPTPGQIAIAGAELTRASQVTAAEKAASAAPSTVAASQPSTSTSPAPATISMTPASGPQIASPTSHFAQPTVMPGTAHQTASDSLLPSWWAILIGALAIVLVTFGAWKGLKFVRSKGQK